MSLSVLDMSVSVDGSVADTNDYLGGENGERLHAWAESRDPSRPVKRFEDEWKAAGAVLAGRRTAELMDHWGYPLVTYVSDGIESSMEQAKAAAGGRDVQVRGANVAQRALEAGVLDEIQIHQIPVLLGGGRRLFDVLPALIELDIREVVATPEATPTPIRYQVRY